MHVIKASVFFRLLLFSCVYMQVRFRYMAKSATLDDFEHKLRKKLHILIMHPEPTMQQNLSKVRPLRAYRPTVAYTEARLLLRILSHRNDCAASRRFLVLLYTGPQSVQVRWIIWTIGLSTLYVWYMDWSINSASLAGVVSSPPRSGTSVDAWCVRLCLCGEGIQTHQNTFAHNFSKCWPILIEISVQCFE